MVACVYKDLDRISCVNKDGKRRRREKIGVLV